jgi:hypothetical protein
LANYGGSTVRNIDAATVANVEDIVTLASCDAVTVTNRGGGTEIAFTLDGTDPTVGGANVHVVPAAVGASLTRHVEAGGRVQTNVASTDQYHPAGTTESAVAVRVIASAIVDYSAEVAQ